MVSVLYINIWPQIFVFVHQALGPKSTCQVLLKLHLDSFVA